MAMGIMRWCVSQIQVLFRGEPRCYKARVVADGMLSGWLVGRRSAEGIDRKVSSGV